MLRYKLRFLMTTTKILSLLFVVLVMATFSGGAQDSAAATNATVMSESLPVYSRMSTSSTVVTSLKKGDKVTVTIEIKGTDLAWCSVRGVGESRAMGYVQCQGLERAVMAPTGTGTLPAVIAAGKVASGSAATQIRRPRGYGKVYFVPVADFPPGFVEELRAYYRDRYGLEAQLLPTVALQPSMIDPNRHQLQAEDLIQLIRRQNPAQTKDPSAIVIGLTATDMISPGFKRYAWNVAEGRFEVISSFRMNPTNYGDPPDDVLLRTRLRKMVTRAIGFLYYRLPANQNPKSLLYAHMPHLEELDAADEDF
jgi:predicted Zn-dependent protease